MNEAFPGWKSWLSDDATSHVNTSSGCNKLSMMPTVYCFLLLCHQSLSSMSSRNMCNCPSVAVLVHIKCSFYWAEYEDKAREVTWQAQDKPYQWLHRWCAGSWIGYILVSLYAGVKFQCDTCTPHWFVGLECERRAMQHNPLWDALNFVNWDKSQRQLIRNIRKRQSLCCSQYENSNTGTCNDNWKDLWKES